MLTLLAGQDVVQFGAVLGGQRARRRLLAGTLLLALDLAVHLPHQRLQLRAQPLLVAVPTKIRLSNLSSVLDEQRVPGCISGVCVASWLGSVCAAVGRQ